MKKFDPQEKLRNPREEHFDLHKMISTHELKVLTREKNKLHHKTDEGKRPRDLVGSLETSEA